MKRLFGGYRTSRLRRLDDSRVHPLRDLVGGDDGDVDEAPRLEAARVLAKGESAGDAADVVVTMGCGDTCPIFPGKRYLDWELPDPKGRPIEEVREIRDEIAKRVKYLVAELG